MVRLETDLSGGGVRTEEFHQELAEKVVRKSKNWRPPTDFVFSFDKAIKKNSMDVRLETDLAKGGTRSQEFEIDHAQVILNKSKNWRLPQGSEFSFDDGQLFKTPVKAVRVEPEIVQTESVSEATPKKKKKGNK